MAGSTPSPEQDGCASIGPVLEENIYRAGLLAAKDGFGEAGLLEFPRRPNGSQMLLRERFFAQLLSGESNLMSVPAADVTAAQGDVRYLGIPQLLRIRCDHLESSHPPAISQFLDTVDEYVTKRLAERLSSHDGPAIQASQAGEVVRLVILIYGANRCLAEQGTTPQCPYWLVRHAGLEALLHLPNCQLRSLQAVKEAARCHRSHIRTSAAVSRDRRKLHWEIHLSENPSSFDSSVPERKATSPRKGKDPARRAIPFDTSPSNQDSKEEQPVSPPKLSAAVPSLSSVHAPEQGEEVTRAVGQGSDGVPADHADAPGSACAEPPSAEEEIKATDTSVSPATATEGEDLQSGKPAQAAQAVKQSKAEENREDWEAKYKELLQLHSDLQARLDQVVAEAARTAHSLQVAEARNAEIHQSNQDHQATLETVKAEAASARMELGAVKVSNTELHAQISMLEGRMEELLRNAGAAKAAQEAEERATTAAEEIRVLRAELQLAKADAVRGKLAEEAIAKLRAELVKNRELLSQPPSRPPWLFCCSL
eukprot:gnl/TRDRNA2_/TRDRNA2_80549_c0_seq1.p1 gnl/TRDRNA2_/TRDRNA2_80549_c0~~gnl/TRDRNA2_/TRDRNA2_80549_c0_seq1.p1  ORF type:complete len:539 (-),score=105.60 gnl/TRDRNA2_/TRDRNA2_80549_c0_seq1:75-1691(-)